MTSSARTRVTNEPVARPYIRTIEYKDAATTTVPGFWASVGVHRSCSDVVTKGFEKLRDQGAIISNPFSSIRSIVTSADKAGQITRGGTLQSGDYYISTWSNLSGLVCCPPTGSVLPVSTMSTSDLDTLAFTGAVSKMGAPDIQGLVSLGELHQTLNLLVRPYKAIRAWLRNPKAPKGSFTSEAFANYWLTYRYGIIPAISDIQGLMKALSRAVDETIRSTARSFEKDTATSSRVVSYTDSQLILSATCTQNEQYMVSGGVLYESYLTLADRLGMTLGNVGSSLWEMLPWSFVYDWLINVGDVIAALEATARCKTLCAWTSSTHWIQCNYICDTMQVTSTSEAFDWSVTQSCTGGTAVGDYRLKNRRPRPVSDIGLVAKLKLTPKRVVDALALGRTNLRVK